MPSGASDSGWSVLANLLANYFPRRCSDRHYRLDRMRNLYRHFGFPDYRCQIIHVAGSKGKGSTATFIAAALQQSGAVVGLFTSPHLCCYRERIRVFNADYSASEMLAELAEITRLIDHPPSWLADEPSFFEIITILALLVFRRCGCRYVVLEVGLGGRLDATNVVQPLASVITAIEYEHCSILGHSLGEIAREKAGIIKPQVPVFVGWQQREVADVLQQVAAEHRSPIFFIDQALREKAAAIVEHCHGALCYPAGQRFFFQWQEDCSRGGVHSADSIQLDNIALALHTLRQLFDRRRAEPSWLLGISRAKLPGRATIIVRQRAIFCLDGAHTKQSAQAAWQTFSKISGPGERLLIFAALPDKDVTAIAALLGPHFKRVLLPQLDNSGKKVDLVAIKNAFGRYSDTIELFDSAAAALASLPTEHLTLICGSFYLVGDCLTVLEGSRVADNILVEPFNCRSSRQDSADILENFLDV